MIHAVPARMWYVEGYLIPDLLAQGIERDDIRIWCDTHGKGCLESCIEAFESLDGKPGGTWHLQDDVLIAADFSKRAQIYGRDEIACGFCVDSFDTSPSKVGRVPQCFLWLSFPCIYIPNAAAAEFARWYRIVGDNDPEIKRLRALRKGDDTLFWLWHHNARMYDWGYNVVPNLVEHVDFLLGGSIVNRDRERGTARAKYWLDPAAVDKLAARLQNRIEAQA